MCSPLYKGGETKLKVGVNALEGGVVNTVKTLNVENGGGYMTPPQLLWWPAYIVCTNTPSLLVFLNSLLEQSNVAL